MTEILKNLLYRDSNSALQARKTQNMNTVSVQMLTTMKITRTSSKEGPDACLNPQGHKVDRPFKSPYSFTFHFSLNSTNCLVQKNSLTFESALFSPKTCAGRRPDWPCWPLTPLTPLLFAEPVTRSLVSNSTWPRLVGTAGTCLTCAGLLFLWLGINSSGGKLALFVLAGMLAGEWW